MTRCCRTGLALVLAAAGFFACADEDAAKRLDSMDERLTSIEGKLENIELWVQYLGRAEREAEEAGDGDNATGKLDDIDRRLGSIEKSLDKGAGRPDPLRGNPLGRVRPTRPDADTVYAVPIAGAPYRGRKHAKVTIVEAFEFA